MKPINFKESNKILAKPETMTIKECKSLRIFTNEETCISCWQASFSERLKILLVGKIWASILSGETQPPIRLDSNSPFLKNQEQGGLNRFLWYRKIRLKYYCNNKKKINCNSVKWLRKFLGCNCPQLNK